MKELRESSTMPNQKLWVVILALIAGLQVVKAGTIPMESSCPSEEGGNVTLFTISDCEALPCNFIRGKLYHLRLDFTPGRDSSVTRVKCGSVVWGTPQTVADWNACEDLHEGCPIEAFKVSSWRASIRVPQVPPGMYPLYCEFIDEGGLRQLCVSGNARIVIW